MVVLAVAACSSDEKPPATEPTDTQPPSVIGVEPGVGSLDLRLLQPFTVSFSEAMDPTSLNSQTIRIGPGTVPLQIQVAPSGLAVVVQPDSMLPADQTIALTLDGPADLAGNELPPFTLHAATGPMDCAHLSDRFEPNESAGTATTVDTDTVYYGLATCQNDVDLFSVTITDTLKLIAETFVDYADNDAWQIYWQRADGQDYATLGTTANPGQIASFDHTFLPGTYYLKIYGYYEEERILYDLRLRTDIPCRDDPYEDNDFMEEAKPLSAGLHEGLLGCYLDEDWFSIPIRAGQNLVLTTDTHEYQSIRRSIIMTPDGGGYQSTLSGVSTFTINWITEADGDARVMSMVWGDGVVYDMTIAIID
jgi:hypothetical protein